MIDSDEYWKLVESAGAMTERDAENLHSMLHSTPFLKAVRGVYEQCEAAKENLFKLNFEVEAERKKAQEIQARVRASFAVIDTLLAQATPSKPADEEKPQ